MSIIASLALTLGLSAQPLPPDMIVRRMLVADTVINGIPCAKSGRAPAEFHRNGHVAACEISRDHQIAAHRFARGTWLDLNPQGVLWSAWLAQDTRLDGISCRGEGYKAWSVRFHPNGKLAGCSLSVDTVVAGVPCMRGTLLREVRGRGRTALQFYSNGAFRRCMAARDTTLDGNPIRKWQVVERDSTS